MLAIDTNIVVRFITEDDLDQADRVEALLVGEDIFLPTTVLLECGWVLSKAYKFERGRVIERLRAFCSLPRVALQEPERVVKAFAWAESGMDFADALHLAAASDCEAFVSFDKRLARRAAGAVPVREP